MALKYNNRKKERKKERKEGKNERKKEGGREGGKEGRRKEEGKKERKRKKKERRRKEGRKEKCGSLYNCGIWGMDICVSWHYYLLFFFHVCLNNFTIEIKRDERSGRHSVSFLGRFNGVRVHITPSRSVFTPSNFCIFVSHVTFWVISSNIFLAQLFCLQLY
jgi:hypothetical protein